MNFEFSEEQNLLRDQARGFLAQHCPMSRVRAALEADGKHDADLWGKVAEMGWTSTVIPEEYGGLGLSYYELAVIAEELGRAVVPVPFSTSVYLATEALLLAGGSTQKQAWLEKLATGAAIGTFALAEGAGEPSPATTGATVKGGKLTGSKWPVADGEAADFAIVSARSGSDAGLYLVDLSQAGVTRTPVRTLDFTRPHARLDFSGAGVEPLGDGKGGWPLVERLLERAAVLYAWEQIGGSEAALAQAREYALGRYAFGRPIGGRHALAPRRVLDAVRLVLPQAHPPALGQGAAHALPARHGLHPGVRRRALRRGSHRRLGAGHPGRGGQRPLPRPARAASRPA
jgi:alkylation response protein AidB-like acyl-CoA dehydrogenase